MPTKARTKSKNTKTKAKKTTARKSSSATKTLRKKTAKSKTGARKSINVKRGTSPSGKKARKKPKFVGLDALEPKRARGRSGRQAGDLQGVSREERADSESVADLLEEGNTFEAQAVAGVEAGDVDEREVHTQEVPEDDVPEEYLEED